MSLFSTYSAASIRGFSAPTSSIPANYNLLYSIETTANKDSRYTFASVSRENIGNGQFVVTKQPFIGNVNIRNIANTFSKTISNLTANSAVGDYNAVINEQGNLLIVGDSDYIKVYEYQGSNYTLISNLRPKANVAIYNGLCLDISSNANILLAGCGGANFLNPFIAVYARSGNTFTLVENIEPPIGSTEIGRVLSISADGNTFITQGRNANASQALIFNYANGNYVLNTTLSNANTVSNLVSNFGDSVKLNASGNVATIRASSRVFVFQNINNSWIETANISTFEAIGANYSTINDSAINLNGSTVVIGNQIAFPTDTGALYNYYKNGTTYTQRQILTWANQYADSFFGHNLAGDNDAKYLAATNYFNGANSNVHVLSVYENINTI